MAASDSMFNDFANGLQQEALGEMADSFFGPRKLIEEELEQLRNTLQELDAIAERALDRLALLHALLLEREAAAGFYGRLQLDPTNVFNLIGKREPRLGFPLPGGLRWSARFLRLFELAYTFAQDACTTYLHGRYRRDPATGTRGLTLHYYKIEQWCASMNRRIAHLNKTQPPSVVISFARGLRENQGQADALGATLGNLAPSVDSNLCLPSLQCGNIGVGPLPEFPSPARASEVVHDFARQHYASNQAQLRELMRRLEEKRQQALLEMEKRFN